MSKTKEIIRIFFDMDGVMAYFDRNSTIEEVASAGYFSSRIPMTGTLEAMKWLVEKTKLEVYVLTSVFNDDHSRQEKLEWLRKYAPFIQADHIIFATYGVDSKADVIGRRFSSDILVDDHTPNLKGAKGWHGVGVKFLNDINGNGASGGYDGYYVSWKTEPTRLAKQLYGIAMTEAEGRWTA